MHTRVMLVKKDRRIVAEKTKKTFKLWEWHDGFHTFDAIFTHKEGLFSPVLIHFEDIVSPLGSERSVDSVNTVGAIVDLVKDGGGKPSVSKMFSRFLDKIGQYLIWIFVAGLIGFVFVLYFTQPGVFGDNYGNVPTIIKMVGGSL